jgi:hypothetical protein
MPFADAKYPPSAKRLSGGGWPAYTLTLTNGERLYIEEAGPKVEIALCCKGTDDPDLWVCAITRNGVLTYGCSGDSCERIAREVPPACRT